MGPLRSRLDDIQERIAAAEARAGAAAGSVQLVVVTKYSTPERIRELYDLGLRQLGESRVAQLVERAEALPTDISWHMIGHLQSNKINKLLPRAGLIQSVDSIGLAQAIDKRARPLQRRIPVLLEVRTAADGGKTGCPLGSAPDVYAAIAACPQLELRGLMTMAPHTPDEKSVRRSFQELRRLRETLSQIDPPPEILSMGMSQDFEWAIEEGANMVRIGRALVDV